MSHSTPAALSTAGSTHVEFKFVGWSGCPSAAGSAQLPYYIPAAGLDAHQLLAQPNFHTTYLRLVWMPINCWLSPIAILHTCNWSGCPSTAGSAQLPYYNLRLVWMPNKCWLSPIAILHTCGWSGCPSTADSAQSPYYIPAAGLDAHQLLTQPNCHATYLRLVWMPINCWLSPIAILHTCGWSGCPSTAGSAQLPYCIPAAGLDAHQLLARPNCQTTYLRLVWMPINCWLSPIAKLHTCGWSRCPSTAGSAQLPYYIPAAGLDAHQLLAQPNCHTAYLRLV